MYYLHEEGNFAPSDVLVRLKVTFPWHADQTEEEVDTIPEIRYRCPQCGKLEMELVKTGCWD